MDSSDDSCFTPKASPCAACKLLRRRCVENCVLAPYFPPTEPHKFTTAHTVFGASNMIKMLRQLPESEREDAVTSMVYEASARIRDPVYGCAGTIWQLHQQLTELQAQLAKAQAELLGLQGTRANLIYKEFETAAQPPPSHSQDEEEEEEDFESLNHLINHCDSFFLGPLY